MKFATIKLFAISNDYLDLASLANDCIELSLAKDDDLNDKIDALKALASEFELPVTHIGTVTSGEIGINGQSFVNVVKIADIYENAIAHKMNA